MSMCVVHMQKMKMSALGGIQSHNQREHESKNNKEIDYEKSKRNFDTVNSEAINYQRSIKGRIAELNLPKAVRKDAVVYCSFIVSSDKEFFKNLGRGKYDLEKYREKQYFSWDESYRDTYDDFDNLPEYLQEKYIQEGAKSFFEIATSFFQARYGIENVINGTVHMDEATPHMHLGIVPVTSDGRLSAKSIFTPLELKQLQSDFAEEMGYYYGLERGKEGSKAKHLDEVSFKLSKRQEQLKDLETAASKIQARQNEVALELEERRLNTKRQAAEVQRQLGEVQKAKQDVEQLRLELYTKVNELDQAIKEYKKATEETKNKLWQAVESRNDLLYSLAKLCDTLRITVNDKVMSVWDYFRTGSNTALEHRTPKLIAEVYELHSKLMREKSPQNTPTRSQYKDNTKSR